jgi:hypothetical protein
VQRRFDALEQRHRRSAQLARRRVEAARHETARLHVDEIAGFDEARAAANRDLRQRPPLAVAERQHRGMRPSPDRHRHQRRLAVGQELRE